MEGCGIPDTGHDITAVRFSITDISVTSPSHMARAGTISMIHNRSLGGKEDNSAD